MTGKFTYSRVVTGLDMSVGRIVQVYTIVAGELVDTYIWINDVRPRAYFFSAAVEH